MEQQILDFINKKTEDAKIRLKNSQGSMFWRNYWAGYVEALKDIQKYYDTLLSYETNKMLAEQKENWYEENT